VSPESSTIFRFQNDKTDQKKRTTEAQAKIGRE
jgi:hypothetical protein